MGPLRLAELARLTDARLAGDTHKVHSCSVSDISIDTRSLESGALYIALQGERYDGHDFAERARAAGAAALLLERELPVALPQLVVNDTRHALSELAHEHASRCSPVTIAITGSNGKTTVKEMVGSILGQVGDVCVTAGNRNNDIGVPLTLLSLEPRHRYLVLEMGANHVGEIASLVRLVTPKVAVVTNVEASHLEGFGSIEQVAAAKSEIFGGLQDSGIAVINADNRFADTMRKASSHCKQIDYGLGSPAAVRGVQGPKLHVSYATEQFSVQLPLPGRHNAMNALAASAVALGLGINASHITAGLEAMRGVAGRLERKAGLRGAQLIDDTYNANPASVQAAIEVLAAEQGVRIFVLGDMHELGDDARRLHGEAGERARAAGIEELLTVGRLSAEAAHAFGSGTHYEDIDALLEALEPRLEAGHVVLVKGSRSARMERVVNRLERPSDMPFRKAARLGKHRGEPSA